MASTLPSNATSGNPPLALSKSARYDVRMPADSPHVPPEKPTRQPIYRLLWRAMRLRCPACGGPKLFRGWFAMNEKCGDCGRPFHGDAGYFLGSIYFNYGVTGILTVILYFTMYFKDILTNEQRLAVLSVFVVLFPVWFFRYARSLWMAVDEFVDPTPSK